MSALTCTCRHTGGDYPHLSMCPSYIKQKYDMVARYREADINVWADHCPGCGRWAHVIAGNSGADDVVWRRTICERCGIREVETTWHEGIGWVDELVATGGEK